MNLNILFEDTHLLVLYKPAGVPVQSAKVGSKDCVSLLKNYLFEKAPENGEPYLGLIHRLDQPVEGILVFAKTPFAAKELSRQVTDATMKKYYLALRYVNNLFGFHNNCGKSVDNVDSSVDKSGKYVDFLLKNGKDNTSRIVSEKTPGAQRAELTYEVLAEKDGIQLVKIRLITGRHHQIRVQMAGHGHPLAGDLKYNPQPVDNENVDKKFSQGVALCAYRLEFIHPKTKKLMVYEIRPEHPGFSLTNLLPLE